jgi:hypothetical protein
MNKKGEVGRLVPIIMTLVLVGILLGLSFIVLGKFLGTMTPASTEYNATEKVITALYDIPNTWLTLIVTIVIISIVLMIVLGIFGGRKMK